MTTFNAKLAGLKLLVVEDEALVMMLLEDMLEDFGCSVVGSAASVTEALTIVGEAPEINAALLDLNLAGEPSHPVADALAARRVPFAFMSGYGPAATQDSRFAAAPVLSKPFEQPALAAVITQLTAPQAESRPSLITPRRK